MLINLVLVSITAMMFVQLFYGNDPNAPIGN
jgi:phospholipid/cholesterol/gamma-HCH transport system permease protein